MGVDYVRCKFCGTIFDLVEVDEWGYEARLDILRFECPYCGAWNVDKFDKLVVELVVKRSKGA